MIDILIPTYNRSKPLEENLNLLAKQIIKDSLQDYISIIISDNASTDNTLDIIEKFKEKYSQIKIKLHKQSTNVGLEQNAVNVLQNASEKYVMFIGDDDFLPEGYLNYCIKAVNTSFIGYIVPGLASLYSDGSHILGRQEEFEEITLQKGFNNMRHNSHLGHQMSGILLLRDGLIKDYLKNEKNRTPYLFIYFLANRMYNYQGIYVPKFKVKVSMDNPKDWSYNQIGLLDEVYKAYYPFANILGEKKVASLMLHFTAMHSYRIDFTKTFWQNYKNIKNSAKPVQGFANGLLWLLMKEYIYRKIK